MGASESSAPDDVNLFRRTQCAHHPEPAVVNAEVDESMPTVADPNQPTEDEDPWTPEVQVVEEAQSIVPFARPYVGDLPFFRPPPPGGNARNQIKAEDRAIALNDAGISGIWDFEEGKKPCI